MRVLRKWAKWARSALAETGVNANSESIPVPFNSAHNRGSSCPARSLAEPQHDRSCKCSRCGWLACDDLCKRLDRRRKLAPFSWREWDRRFGVARPARRGRPDKKPRLEDRSAQGVLVADYRR